VPEPVDCCALLEEVMATLRLQAEAKGLALSAELPAVALMWPTDRRALSQIIINLTGNAIKFTDSGSVKLRLAQQQHGDVDLLQITVEDTGVGIPEEDQPKLFGAFSRVGTLRPRASEGTGLGLHLSQKLAELLGGRISFVSRSGEGSTFILQLARS
jgi:signal transduction histidine kinase